MTEPTPATGAEPTAATPSAAQPAAATQSGLTESTAAQPASAQPAAAQPAAAQSAEAQPAAAAGTPEPSNAKGADAKPADAATHSKSTDITAGPGGVMTNEVGVVTGDLTLRSEYADGKVTVHVQYKEADEWYVVTGGKAKLADAADLEAVHSIVVGLLNRPEG
jgi:hypothetical protein